MEKKDAVETASSDEDKTEDAQPEFAALSAGELAARRKKAVKTVIIVGIVSLLIFFYTMYSGS